MRDSKQLPVFILYFILFPFFFYCFVSYRQALRLYYYCVKEKKKKDAICFYNMLSISFCLVNNLESFLFGDAVV